MTTMEELQLAITALPEADYSRLRQWFLDRDWQKCDRDIETDMENGRLDVLLQEAKKLRDA
jgi:hypothetical protein